MCMGSHVKWTCKTIKIVNVLNIYVFIYATVEKWAKHDLNNKSRNPFWFTLSSFIVDKDREHSRTEQSVYRSKSGHLTDIITDSLTKSGQPHDVTTTMLIGNYDRSKSGHRHDITTDSLTKYDRSPSSPPAKLKAFCKLSAVDSGSDLSSKILWASSPNKLNRWLVLLETVGLDLWLKQTNCFPIFRFPDSAFGIDLQRSS